MPQWKDLFVNVPRDPNVLVGFGTLDDAGVYRLSETQALVQTVDFITPVVDDPFTFGEIAIANALSDVWAMGGRPITALNVAAFPVRLRCRYSERHPARRPGEVYGGGRRPARRPHGGRPGDQVRRGSDGSD